MASFPAGGKKIFCAASCSWTLLSANLYPANSRTPATMRTTVTTIPPVDISQSNVLLLMTPPLFAPKHACCAGAGGRSMVPAPPGPSTLREASLPSETSRGGDATWERRTCW